MIRPVLLALLILKTHTISAQISPSELNGADLNHLRTSVPFLTIAPDARAAGMGDVGAASEPDMNAQHWNLAKYAFMEGNGGLAFTYTAWLRNLIPGLYLANFSSYYKINRKHILSSSFRYFHLAGLSFARMPARYNPREYAVDMGYSRLFTEHFSAGLSFRYIHSALLESGLSGDYRDGTSFAGDLAFYYVNQVFMGEKTAHWAVGLALTNLGPPITYTRYDQRIPIPTNLRMGGRILFPFRSQHTLSIQADLNKLLVPTPPVYERDSATGDYRLVRGKAPPKSVFAGMIQSFYDAPGVQKNKDSYSIFREEMYEIMYALGLEYLYKHILAIRTGYFHEHETKGNRKYFTLGIGVTYQILSMDISYLISVDGQNSPLANTLGVTLSCEFGRPVI